MELLERGRELDELQSALSRARSGDGCVVLVGGEAGIGKTSLVDRFTAALTRSTPRLPVFWGACDALFTPRPLGPLLDMLPQCSAGLRSLVEAGALRERVFSAFLEELRHQERASVVVFEDVHWADEATLDLLKFVGRRIRQTPALVIATYRDDEVGTTHPLRPVLGELPKDALQRIRLPLLSPDAVAQLAQRAGRSGEGLHALTGGNPFFVTEVLAGGQGVPSSVQDAVLARASRLAPAARSALDPLSVVPGRTEAWLLEALIGSDASERIAECTAAGILISTPASIAFRHELARRAWEEVLEPARARALHAQVLEALLDRGADQVGLARIVYHADRAGDSGHVRHFAPAAAREASALGAHREAAAHWQMAVQYAGGLPAAERAALLESLAYERHLIAEIDAAVHAREAALALRRALGDRLREGSNLRWLSRLTWFSFQRERALEIGKDAVRVLEPLGPTPELAIAYSNLAQLAMLADEFDDAIAWGDRAIHLAEQLGDVDTLAHALINVGTARLYAGYDARGHVEVERALAIAIENGFHEHALRSYTCLGCYEISHHHYDRAERVLAATIAFAAEHDSDTFLLYMTGWRARLHLERGRWAAAEEDARGVVDRYHILDIMRFPALTVLGLLRVRRGEPGADEALEEALALATASRETQRLGPAVAALCEAAWIRGDLAAARSAAEDAWKLAAGTSSSWRRGSIAYWVWRLGGFDTTPDNIAEPYRLEMTGDARGAAAEWKRLGCPYEYALALAQLDDADAQREALETLEQLGARAAAEAVRRDLRRRGVRGVPRGPRAATRDNAAGLTRSQLRVLALLAQGISNAEIARELFLSPRTVDHHVSAILQRLGVRTRAEAIACAHTRALIPGNKAEN